MTVDKICLFYESVLVSEGAIIGQPNFTHL